MAFSDPGKGRVVSDSGRGTEPEKVTLAEDCKCGDVLGYSTGWKRALATTGSVIQGRLVALADGKSGEEVPVSANPVIGGYSGATSGGYIYVADGAGGMYILKYTGSSLGECFEDPLKRFSRLT